VRERVRIEGAVEVFLVVWVDRDSETAQVIPLLEGDELLSVPFSAIQRVDGSTDTSVA
jgi:hypothetical protein